MNTHDVTTRSTTIVAPSKLAHVAFRTSRLQAMCDWYRLVLGARVVHENAGLLAFLTFDDEHHRIALVHFPGLADASRGAVGVEHVAFTYADLGELVATYRRLAAHDLAPYMCVNHGPTTSLYYRDPDANSVELQVDNFADDAALRTWFATADYFRANPVGPFFDPDEVARRWESGMAHHDCVPWGDEPGEDQ